MQYSDVCSQFGQQGGHSEGWRASALAADSYMLTLRSCCCASGRAQPVAQEATDSMQLSSSHSACRAEGRPANSSGQAIQTRHV